MIIKIRLVDSFQRGFRVSYAQLMFTHSCDGRDLTEGPSANFILGHDTELVLSGRKKIGDQQTILSREV